MIDYGKTIVSNAKIFNANFKEGRKRTYDLGGVSVLATFLKQVDSNPGLTDKIRQYVVSDMFEIPRLDVIKIVSDEGYKKLKSQGIKLFDGKLQLTSKGSAHSDGPNHGHYYDQFMKDYKELVNELRSDSSVKGDITKLNSLKSEFKQLVEKLADSWFFKTIFRKAVLSRDIYKMLEMMAMNKEKAVGFVDSATAGELDDPNGDPDGTIRFNEKNISDCKRIIERERNQPIPDEDRIKYMEESIKASEEKIDKAKSKIERYKKLRDRGYKEAPDIDQRMRNVKSLADQIIKASKEVGINTITDFDDVYNYAYKNYREEKLDPSQQKEKLEKLKNYEDYAKLIKKADMESDVQQKKNLNKIKGMIKKVLDDWEKEHK